MKLAELLLTRTEYKTRLSEVKSRITGNVQVQEGDKPNEDPNVMLNEIREVSNKLNTVVKQINQINCNTKFDETRSLADALVDRESLKSKRGILSDIVYYASSNSHRSTKSEIKMITVVSVADLNKEIDSLSKEIREIDTKIQALNWTIDVD